MKYRTAFAMALAALILTACAAEPAAGITPAAESAAPAVTTQEPPPQQLPAVSRCTSSTAAAQPHSLL